MKKIVIISLLLIAAVFSKGQKLGECYISTVTNDTVKSTLWENVVYSEGCMLSYRFLKFNSEYIFELRINFGRQPSFCIGPNDSIWIKFEEGLSITLRSKDSLCSQIGKASYPGTPKGLTTHGIYTTYPVSFMELVMMQMQRMVKIRFFSSRGFDNITIPPSEQRKIMRDAAVISKRVDRFETLPVAPEYRNDGRGIQKNMKSEEW